MIAEQIFLTFSNLFFVPPIFASIWKHRILFFIITLFVFVDSTLYHLSSNPEDIKNVFGVDPSTTPGVIDWKMDKTSALFLLFSDFASSNIGFIIFIAILSPKSNYNNTYIITISGIIIYLLTILITGATNSSTADPFQIYYIFPIVSAYNIFVYLISFIHYKYYLKLSVLDYYKHNFIRFWLILAICCIIIGALCWTTIQNIFPSTYFYIHGCWHIFAGLALTFAILSDETYVNIK